MMGRWDYGYGTSGGVIATLVAACIGALILIGLIILLVYLVRAASGHGGHHYGARGEHRTPEQGQGSGFDFLGPRGGGADEALEIARRRFAAGEITREQYDELIAALNR